ncbi:hypothetical protein D3C85_1268190 [compost metagenome]
MAIKPAWPSPPTMPVAGLAVHCPPRHTASCQLYPLTCTPVPCHGWLACTWTVRASRSLATVSAAWNARAVRVRVGLAVPVVGNTPSPTRNRLPWSQLR